MWHCVARRIRSRGIDCVDPSPRDHHQSTCAKGVLSDVVDDLPGDTWTRRDRPIIIGRAKQAEGVGHDLRLWGTRGCMMSFWFPSDGRYPSQIRYIEGRRVDTSRLTSMLWWQSDGGNSMIVRLWLTITARSRPTIIVWLWPSISLHRIKWPAFFTGIPI